MMIIRINAKRLVVMDLVRNRQLDNLWEYDIIKASESFIREVD